MPDAGASADEMRSQILQRMLAESFEKVRNELAYVVSVSKVKYFKSTGKGSSVFFGCMVKSRRACEQDVVNRWRSGTRDGQNLLSDSRDGFLDDRHLLPGYLMMTNGKRLCGVSTLDFTTECPVSSACWQRGKI